MSAQRSGFSVPPEAQRRALREDAMLNAPAPFLDAQGAFGPPIFPLSPWSHLLLSRHANPFFTGGIPTLDAVLQLLWFLSPEFWALKHHPSGEPRRNFSPTTSRLRFWLFRLRWRSSVSSPVRLLSRGPSQRVLNAIRLHIAEAIAEPLPRPPRKVGEPSPEDDLDQPLHHEIAGNEVLCSKILGIHGALFWHRPYAHTRQLLAIALENRPRAPSAPKFDRATDKKISAYLRARKASQGVN